ncbi:hypothetical protein KSP40_PGU017789 [Platanthera guangdongensis]|uniref:CASP-like protein n=1 Tax=Platanthera guangdongensis TaxID=2320717 RepID=A0ABR2MPX2_9ASPA
MASSTPEVALNSDAGKYGGYGAGARRSPSFSGVDFGLRILLFASSVSALVVLATSKQTVSIPVFLQAQTPIFVTKSAQFYHSPAFTICS